MNILLPFTILILSWSIDTTDPAVQSTITYIFAAVHSLAFALFIYIFVCIWRRGDPTLIEVKEPYTNERTIQKYWEYDCSRLRDLFFSKVGLSTGISIFVATRFGIPFPLLLQCLNNPKAIYDSELFQIYVLGRPEENELARPWKDHTMVPEWIGKIWSMGEKDSESMFSNGGSSGVSKSSRRKVK